jgi:hypothetical protein
MFRYQIESVQCQRETAGWIFSQNKSWRAVRYSLLFQFEHFQKCAAGLSTIMVRYPAVPNVTDSSPQLQAQNFIKSIRCFRIGILGSPWKNRERFSKLIGRTLNAELRRWLKKFVHYSSGRWKVTAINKGEFNLPSFYRIVRLSSINANIVQPYLHFIHLESIQRQSP